LNRIAPGETWGKPGRFSFNFYRENGNAPYNEFEDVLTRKITKRSKKRALTKPFNNLQMEILE
jgi:hypothetical protein